MSVRTQRRLRSLVRSAWFYLVAIVSVLVAGVVARALRDELGGVIGIALGILVALLLAFVLTLAGLVISAWMVARRKRTRSPEGP